MADGLTAGRSAENGEHEFRVPYEARSNAMMQSSIRMVLDSEQQTEIEEYYSKTLKEVIFENIQDAKPMASARFTG